MLPDQAKEKGSFARQNIQIQVSIHCDMFEHVETVLSVEGQINDRYIGFLFVQFF